tara:strand:- start:369 stop:1928 length:1560 start_codon:yes stop_codon:yes gene_type:complete
MQYDQMDQDSEVNAALDIIAEFCTQSDSATELPLEVRYKSEATETEINLLQSALKQWCNINDMDRRVWRLVRSVLKYGDQFFIRDPENWKLYWVDPAKVEKVVVNEGKGKKIEEYHIKDLDLNLRSLVASNMFHGQDYSSKANPAIPNITGGGTSSVVGSIEGLGMGGGFSTAMPVMGDHVIHLSLSEGLDNAWPFGTSILEPIYKIFKQKEMLEDAILIYRVQRAPERRVFYIDVGDMPRTRAMAFIEQVKNEIHQKRIPNKTGGGANIMDAAYNPLSMIEDYFFAQTAEGRGSKVETLPGGENLGQIDDLKYFNNKLMRGLRVPSSYLPTGPEDGTAVYNDGRVGTAFIQEYRFTNYCERLQQLIAPWLDREFKMFCKHRGIEIESNLFELTFLEPQNFGKYRQIEVDGAQMAVFAQAIQVPFMSKRFAMKRYLGLTDEDIIQNETSFIEESGIATVTDIAGAGMSDVGVRPAEPDALAPDVDMDMGADMPAEPGAESPISGAENAPAGDAPPLTPV